MQLSVKTTAEKQQLLMQYELRFQPYRTRKTYTSTFLTFMCVMMEKDLMKHSSVFTLMKLQLIF